MLDSIWRDIRFSARSLLRRPTFTLIALVILALGIGANTVIFTLINAVVLKQLPVPKPEELVLFNDDTGEGTRQSDGDLQPGAWDYFSYASYRYFREHDKSFQELSAFRSGESRVSVRIGGAPAGQASERSSGHLVSGNYFAVLGVNALKGRVLTNSDDDAAAQPAVVLSNSYWQKRLNSDPEVVGKTLMLNATSFTVVGVMPPEFFGARIRRPPDFWVPLSFQPQIEMRPSYLDSPTTFWLNMIGRLRPGVDLQQAQASATLDLQQFLTAQSGSQLTPERSKAIQNSYISLSSGARGISGLRKFYAQSLSMLMVIVALVLLIACANVGNLLLSRAATRQAEISLRQALGASRWRLMRQLLTESLLLAAVGGIAGILLAQWGVSLMVSRLAATTPLDVKPDASILLFTLAVSLLSGVLFGIVPALRATHLDLSAALKEKSAVGRKRRFNFGSALVVVQVAVSLILLVGAGLFARSLINMQKEDLGFNRDNVLLTSVDTRLAGYKPAELPDVYRRLYEELNAVPNVRSATFATHSPMSGSNRTSNITVRGYVPAPGEDMIVSDLMVGPRFAETLGVPLLMGREIGVQDTPTSARVAVVNKSFADAFFSGQNPIGRRATFNDTSDKEDFEIVGVIGDAKYESAKDKPSRSIYRPIFQTPDQGAFTNVIELRTDGDPLNLTGPVRAAILRVNDKIPILPFTTLRIQTEESLKEEKLIAQLVSFFGLLGLLLSCVGLYGIMAHSVVRRTNEIGIRMALGAERRNIIWMVLRESLLLVAIGLAVGVPAALAAARLISSQLFGLKSTDPLSLLIAVVLLTLVAALAGYLPARKASRVNPLIALRYE